MRTIECNECGEPLTGHDDAALVRRLVGHMADAHSEVEFSEEQAREDVEGDAYSATDN
jgi:predicted small metal-binding protein